MGPSWGLSVTGWYNYSLGVTIPRTEDVLHPGPLCTKCLVPLGHFDKKIFPVYFQMHVTWQYGFWLRTTVSSAYQIDHKIAQFLFTLRSMDMTQ